MKPSFLAARPDARWAGAPKELRGGCDGVEFEVLGRWWGKRWSVTSEAPFPMPERLLLFASRKGMEHGFWRDFRVGDPAFDHRHFVFSDTPALLPIIMGPQTRHALGARTALDDALTLYVRGGVARVTGQNDADDDTALTRHLDVHRALAADHQTFLTAWDELVTSAQGRADPRWPPTGTVMNPVGALRLYLTWAEAARRDVDWLAREDSLRTNLAGNDGRQRSRWSLREAEPFEAHDLELGAGRYLVTGKPTLSTPALEALVLRGKIVAISSSAQVRVAVRGLATTSQLQAMLRLLETLLQAADSGSPYR
ncbi:MAG: hypothetical protein IPQ07_36480 [Myxococcales bacterium]|nr:hypothetical protein [Myxococcales bacterium]